MTELGGVNGPSMGAYPPSSVSQGTPTAVTPHHTPVDLSHAQRDQQQGGHQPPLHYPIHDPHHQRPPHSTVLDSGKFEIYSFPSLRYFMLLVW